MHGWSLLGQQKSYPEIIFIDVTYKLTELRLPMYIFLVEDSMGESEIAGVGLLVSENAVFEMVVKRIQRKQCQQSATCYYGS